jgi:hypothetical protein
VKFTLNYLPLDFLPYYNNNFFKNFIYTSGITFLIGHFVQSVLNYINRKIRERHLGMYSIPDTDPDKIVKIRVVKEIKAFYPEIINNWQGKKVSNLDELEIQYV